MFFTCVHISSHLPLPIPPPPPAQAAEEETGWKLVHGDVFRAPANGGLLCVLTGAGMQIFGMTCLTIFFAALGA